MNLLNFLMFARGDVGGGVLWTQRSVSFTYGAIDLASSSDGMTIVGISAPSNSVVISQNGGVNWSTVAVAGSNTFGRSIAISSNGQKIAACWAQGYIYTSTDGGVTWTQRITGNWDYITSSSDGTKLAACANLGQSIYTSTDSGATWTQRTSAGSRDWTSITSSSDGSKLAACVGNGSQGYVYTSTDGGATWTERTSSGSRNWGDICMSDDGIKIAACHDGGYIYTSTDGGTTWTERTASGSRNWKSIACSGDGTKLVATSSNVFTSPDGGVTWLQRSLGGGNAVSSSSDGMKLAAGYGAFIYTSP